MASHKLINDCADPELLSRRLTCRTPTGPLWLSEISGKLASRPCAGAVAAAPKALSCALVKPDIARRQAPTRSMTAKDCNSPYSGTLVCFACESAEGPCRQKWIWLWSALIAHCSLQFSLGSVRSPCALTDSD